METATQQPMWNEITLDVSKKQQKFIFNADTRVVEQDADIYLKCLNVASD